MRRRADEDWSIRASALRVGADELIVVSFPLDPPTGIHDELTAAEAEVVTLCLQGMSNEAIASARGVSTKTVSNQLSSVYQKLGVFSRTELFAAMSCPATQPS